MTNDHTIAFPDGVPGFEACRQFQLVRSPESDPFTIVRGEGPGAPAFVAIDPGALVPDYRRTLDAADAVRLQHDGQTPLLWLAIVTVHEDGRVTANLRAPLVINPAAMRGIQVVSAASPYRIDHPLQAA